MNHLDIRDFTVSSWRDIIGVVPQVLFLVFEASVELIISLFKDPVLFSGTIASNIAYGNVHASREQIEAAAREANCEFIWGLPKGFDTESSFHRNGHVNSLTCV